MSDHRTQIGKWYRNRRWANKARKQLRLEPLCGMCEAANIVNAATIADHIVPHKGDYNLFWFGKLQSLCKSHHDSEKKNIEIRGYVMDIGVDGFPIHPEHPFNTRGR